MVAPGPIVLTPPVMFPAPHGTLLRNLFRYLIFGSVIAEFLLIDPGRLCFPEGGLGRSAFTQENLS